MTSVRSAIKQLVSSKWFERASLLIISCNCITLSLANPCQASCQDYTCHILQNSEHAIFAFFVVEMILKIIGFGFIRSPYAYFKDNWNRLDFFIVLAGALEYAFPSEGINISVIRSIRVIRPLRAINRIPSLRLLVTVLIDIMPMLANVFVLYGFIFFIFGIVAVQLWAGLLRQRCYFPAIQNKSNDSDSNPPPFMPEYYTPVNSQYICSTLFGNLKCEDIVDFEQKHSMCNGLFNGDHEMTAVCRKWIGRYSECQPKASNPAWGYVNFDNIGYAVIAIFQVISLEGWSNVMYVIQDTYSFWMWIYFVLLVLLGSYLAVNVCLVIITAQFSKTKTRESQRRTVIPCSYRKSIKKQKAAQSSSFYFQFFQLIIVSIEKLSGGKIDIRSTTTKGRNALSYAHYCKACRYKPKSGDAIARCPNCNSPMAFKKWKWWTISGSRRVLRHAFEDDAAVVVVMSSIIINAVVMAMEHYGQPMEITIIIECVNMAFTIIFLAEFILKFYAYGPYDYFSEGFNALDAIIVTINVIELFSSDDSSGLSVLRLFRLLRLVKILRFMPTLQQQIKIMIRSIDNITSLFVLMTFFIYISSLLGLNLFGCKICEIQTTKTTTTTTTGRVEQVKNVTDANSKMLACNFRVMSFDDEDIVAIPQPNSKKVCYGLFDNIFQSCFTVLQILTQDNWALIMYDAMHFTSVWAAVYFMFLVSVGNYLIFNLVMAILVEAFVSYNRGACAQSMSIRSDSAISGQTLSETWLKTEVEEKEEAAPSKNSILIIKLKWTALKQRLFLSNRSLFIFDRRGSTRTWLQRVLLSNAFEKTYLFFILANCITIMMERQSIGDDSWERWIINVGDYFFSCVFTIEAIAKIIANGFVISQQSYLRDGWNAIDFFLICLTIVHLILESIPSNKKMHPFFEFLEVACLLRALRPMRIASRSKGIRVMIKALILSVKPIGSIGLICCFFFGIFAILGIQLFKGCFSECSIPARNETDINSLTIKTKTDCLANKFLWKTHHLNFDNMFNALVTLFVFSTLDGWTGITLNGVACAGPVPGNNLYAYFYFLAFLFIVCLFVVNMFVGVVVRNFRSVQQNIESKLSNRLKNVCKEEVLGHLALRETPLTKSASNTSKLKQEPDTAICRNYPRWRLRLYNVANHQMFEFFVNAITCVGVFIMSFDYYMMPPTFENIITYIGHVILGLIAIEIVLKVIAFGFFNYIKNRWNQLDVAITILSVGGVLLEKLYSDFFPINPSFVRVFRAFRVVRIFKLLKSATGMRRLIKTITDAIPRCINLFAFFFLLFFVYASLGVNLFGNFSCTYEHCMGLSRHANFGNFGMAMLTLFRIFTGDNWNDILNDVMSLTSDPEMCHQNGAISCRTIYIVTPVYFVSFVLCSQFVLINIVIAILMGNIQFGQATVAEKAIRSAISAEFEHVKTTIIQDYMNDVETLLGNGSRKSSASVDDVVDAITAECVIQQYGGTPAEFTSGTSSALENRSMTISKSDNHLTTKETILNKAVHSIDNFRLSTLNRPETQKQFLRAYIKKRGSQELDK